MYVTRRLSRYRNSPEALSLPPPEGPSSGILVLQDEEANPTCRFGLFNSDKLRHLPLPQNKRLELYYSQGFFPNRSLQFHNVFFIPVLGQPLSSNRYYVIQPYGKDRGEAYTSCKDEDLEGRDCFGGCDSDLPPKRLDPRDAYQQMEISCHGRNLNPFGSEFVAKSVAQDGFPPNFLGRRSGWQLSYSDSLEFELGEAQGLDTALRAQLPDFDFPLAHERSKPVIVGKWYCPFLFIKEGAPITIQNENSRSMYYEMTLEQNWEKIIAKDNYNNEGNAVAVDVVVQSEVLTVSGKECLADEKNLSDGVLWYRHFSNLGEETSVGLSLAVVERMKWEQERVGWVEGTERQVRVERTEASGGPGEYKKFGCYVLIERFVLKRMNGSLVLTQEFRHTHQIRSKWE